MGDTTENTRSADFHLQLPCTPSTIPHARHQVRDWCRTAQIRADLIADIALAVTEAAANAVRHSDCTYYETHAWIRRTSLIITVADHGTGLDAADPGLGMGLEIIRGVTDTVEIDDTHPGTRITMRFARHADRATQ